MLGGRQDGSQCLSLLSPPLALPPTTGCVALSSQAGVGEEPGDQEEVWVLAECGTGLGELHRSPTQPPPARAAADTHRLSTGPRHAGDAFRTRPALGDTEGPQSGLGDCSPRCVTGSWEGGRRLAHHFLDSGLAGGQLWGPGPTLRGKGPSSRSYLRVLGMLSSRGKMRWVWRWSLQFILADA